MADLVEHEIIFRHRVKCQGQRPLCAPGHPAHPDPESGTRKRRAATGRPYTGGWRAESSRPTDGHSAWRVWEAAPHKPGMSHPTNQVAAPHKPKRRTLQTGPPPPQNQSPAPHRPGPPGEKQLQSVIFEKKITFRIQKARKKGRPAGRPFRLCQEAQPLGSSFPSGSSRTLAEAHRPARA